MEARQIHLYIELVLSSTMYQPIEFEDKIIYLTIDTADGVSVNLTDIYTFSVGFYANSEQDFVSKTFQLNNLSNSDADSTNEIIQNIIQIQNNLHPTIRTNVCQFSNDFTHLTLFHEPFKYTLPMSKLTPEEELKLVKSIYGQLEQFSKLQNNLISSLENQILNKNKIIYNLADSYVQRCTYEKIDDIFNSKLISDLFVNRNMLDFAQSTVSDCIEKLQLTSNTSIMNSKNDPLWRMIVQPTKTKSKTLPITKELAPLASSESSPPTSTSKTKRKLQGLLRREQRKRKL